MAMKPNSYRNDREFSDIYLPRISEILRQNAMHIVRVEIATDELDTQQSTDMVINVIGGRVAVRVRRSAYKFRDLTIRSRRRNGSKTELAKLREGYGDWYLYCWTGNDGVITEWILADINKMRATGLLNKERKEVDNHDGTMFIAIPQAELRLNNCLVSYQTNGDVTR